MKKITIIILIISLFSCNNNPKPIKKENILDSLFAMFDNLETISYKTKSYNSNLKGDTLTLHQYFENNNDSTDWMLNFNSTAYSGESFSFQRVYNNNEKRLYYHTKEEYVITDYYNPAENIKGLDEISFSLITYEKYLKKTLNDYPGRVKIKDISINNEELYLIKFANPAGLTIKDKSLFLHNDTTTAKPSLKVISLALIVDRKSAFPKYKILGERIEKISEIVFNIRESGSIWTYDNMPEFFRERVNPHAEIEAELLLMPGTKLPAWQFKTMQDKDYNFSIDKSYHLIIFFSFYCRACIKKIPILNSLSETNNLKVTAVYFGEEPAKLPEFIKKHNIQYEVIINNDKALTEQFSCGGFPVSHLVDDKGIIIYSALGNSPDFEEEILKRTK